MKHIAIYIEYAGLTLPVVKNPQAVEVVPIKPISDLFGLRWESQRVKLQDSWMNEFLGVCTLDIRGAGDQKREQTCIRLDRVAAFMMSLNPAKIHAAGNEEGAAFLKAKLTEWADALHDYETFGVAHNPRNADAQLAQRRCDVILRAMRQHARTKTTAERTLLEAMLSSLAAEAGLPYDPTSSAPSSSPNGGLFDQLQHD